MFRTLRVVVLAAAVLAGCKGSESTTPTPTCSVSAVAVSPTSATVVAGGTTNFTANVTQQNCTNLATSWATGDAAVATISQSGTVTGVAAGVTTVTATANGVSASANLTVTAPPCVVSAVTVTPTTASLAPGDTLTLRTVVAQTNCTGLVTTWTSTAPTVASVSSTGLVTALAQGTTTISASTGGVTGSSAVTVAPPALGSRWTSTQLRLAGAGDAPTGYSNAAWAAGATDLFVASNGDLYRYTAGSWQRRSESGFGVDAMWGSSASDVWGVGQRILRWNGTAWNVVVESPAQPLAAIWGSSPTNVFAVGRGGTILRYDGSAWSPMASPTTVDLVGISGSAANFALAVSATGQVLRWDGSNWSIQATPAQQLRAVWVSSPTLAVAIGGTMAYRFDGAAWTPQALPNANAIATTTVWGSSPTDIYVAGTSGYVAHSNGTTWSLVPQATGTDALSLAGAGSTTYVTGNGFVGTLAPSAITMLSHAPTLNAVWATDANNAFAVGESGTVWRFASGTWQRLNTGVFHELTAVWAASPTQAYAAGITSTGAGVILRYDGNSWSEASIPASGGLVALHGPSANRLAALSRFSPLLTFDGSTWRAGTVGSPPSAVTAMWGAGANDFLVVGTSGFAARFDGTSTLTPVASAPANTQFVSVWGSGASNYFAGTNNGVLHRFDGSAWTLVPTGQSAAFRIWGSSPTTLYTLSFNGGVGRLDGATWTQLKSADSEFLFYGLHGTPTRLFAVGSQGATMVTQ